MKKYLMLIPFTLVVISIIAFFVNKNTEIHKAEKELTNLKELSYELKKSFQNHTKLVDNSSLSVNVTDVETSIKHLEYAINNYLNTLNDLSYDRLYRISKIINEKSTNLSSIYKDITRDKNLMNSAMMDSIKSYKEYMKNKRSLSSSDKAFMNYIFKSTLTKSYKNIVRLNSTKKADILNKDIKALQAKQLSLLELTAALRKNDFVHEINQVILFSFQTSEALRSELDDIVTKLLIGSTFLLIFSLGIYAREIKALEETKKLKSELTEYVYALDNSAIISKSDLKGDITFVNDKFCEISGYEREELLGKSHNIIRHPDMDKKVFEELWDSIVYGDIFQGTIKNRAKDGEAYYVETTIIPLHDEKGKIDEYLSICHDVTQFMKNIS
ncbi:MAG: PAS domain-containing protein [Campylobacterota bacterium]|nr:PAS domain-containing protein [Campylobacterota bacterium]